MTVTRRPTVAALACAALLLTACGGTGPTAGPSSEPAPTSESAVSAPEPTCTTEELLVVADAMAEQGAVHVAGGNQNPPPVLQADLDLLSGDRRVVIDIGGSVVVDARRVGDDVYLGVPEEGDGPTRFGRSDADAPELQLGSSTSGMLPALLAFDPVSELRALAGAAERLTCSPGELDGVPATVAEGSVDGAEYARRLAPDVAPRRLRGSEALLPESFQVWVGPDELALRIQKVSRSGSVEREDYSAWGEPVEVQVPPAELVVETDGS